MEANIPTLIITGTLDNPIVVKSAGDEQFAGCTGYPVDSHVTLWCRVRLVPSFSCPTYIQPAALPPYSTPLLLQLPQAILLPHYDHTH